MHQSSHIEVCIFNLIAHLAPNTAFTASADIERWPVLFLRFSVIVITSYMPSCSFTLANYLQTLLRRSVVRLVKAWLNALSSTCRPLDSELQDWHWALDDVDDIDYDHTFNFWGAGVGFKQGNYLHRGSVPKPPNPPTLAAFRLFAVM